MKLNLENIKKYVKDLERCGERSYNLIDKTNKLDWFVGGDEKKILKFQKKLNIKVDGGVLLEDGVYGKKTADTWIKFFDKLLRLSETAPVVTFDDSSITSNSVSLSGGLGLSPLPASVNAGGTYNSPVLQFNPKDWVEKYLGIK